MRNSWFLVLGLVLGLIPGGVLPVLARAPGALKIFINDHPLAGKALWYRDRIYVPLEEVARSTGGTFTYDPSTGSARVRVGGPSDGPASAGPPEPRPEVAWEREYPGGENLRVVACVRNAGGETARDLQVRCVFRDEEGRVLGTVLRAVGDLPPGQSRTVEFALVEAGAPGGYPAYGYGPGGYYYHPADPESRSGQVRVEGRWTKVAHELTLESR